MSVREALEHQIEGKYHVERELGGGGMSHVFLADDVALARRVVIKVLPPDAIAGLDAERFRREIRLAASLQHPNIVPVLTADASGPLLWYAMPFVEGETLRARLLREQELPVDTALGIWREVLDALSHAHERGIVHRDIKPENILLTGRHAVVTDFGVAKALSAAATTGVTTATGVTLGTPAYMAPEQVAADPSIDHRADLYAAGLVAYEMLAGRSPFAGLGPSQIMAAHATREPEHICGARPTVSEPVASLIMRCLAKRPADRPETAEHIMAVLDLHGGRNVLSPVPPRQTAAGRVALGSKRWVAPSVLGMIAVATAAVAVWATRGGATASVLDGAEVIAVTPLGTTGDTALERLGRELVVTLSTAIDGVGSTRATDAMSVLRAAKASPHPIPLADARAMARNLGARSALHGSLVRVGPRVRAEVALYRVDGGESIVRASAIAPPESLVALTDSLSTGLLRGMWRRGEAPTAYFTDIATASPIALRAFVEADAFARETRFNEAIEALDRAIAADSAFAQAYMRREYLNGYFLRPPNEAIRAGLRKHLDRLPARDRDLLQMRWSTLPVLQKIDSGRVLAEVYRDHPLALQQAADEIIHAGPYVGVPLSEAVPLLERLDSLAPNHADIAIHRTWVFGALGDTARFVRAALDADRLTDLQLYRTREAARLGRQYPTPQWSVRELRESLRAIGERIGPWYYVTEFEWQAQTVGPPSVTDSLLGVLESEGIHRAYPAAWDHARGTLAISRGDFTAGIARLVRVMRTRSPMAYRLSAARAAAIGAWMGTFRVSDARKVVADTRAALGAELNGFDASELQWADGVIAIADTDSLGVVRAAAAIRDSLPASRHLARSLPALWRHRRTKEIDALRALEDSAMQDGSYVTTAMPLHRNAIGRELARRGDLHGAERYLQWTDVVAGTDHGLIAVTMFGAYSAYERGVAFDQARDRRRAILNLSRFLNAVDRPAPGLEATVADARRRLSLRLAEQR